MNFVGTYRGIDERVVEQCMSVGGVINICYHILTCLVSESTKFLFSILGTLVGALILEVLLLYGILNVSSCYFTQF